MSLETIMPPFTLPQSTADYCTLVPDRPAGYNFGPACAAHDVNYGPNTPYTRAQADAIFRADMHNICRQDYNDAALCHVMAEVYYIGVRMFGGAFYEGPGY